MENTLSNMNIDLNNKSAKYFHKADGGLISISDVPQVDIKDFDPDYLVEDVESSENPSEIDDIDTELDNVSAEDSESLKSDSDDAEAESSTETAETVDQFVSRFHDFDQGANVEFAPVEIDDKIYQLSINTIDQDDENNKIIIGVECIPDESTVDTEADNSDDEEVAEEVTDETEEAVDDGDEEVVESFKDLVRQKDLLESEVKSLKNSQTVSDAKVRELEESLNKYKAAFARTSELAANAKQLKRMNESLNAKLSNNTKEIAELKSHANRAATLTESADNNAKRVKSLTEKLQTMQTEFAESKTKLEEQVAHANKKLQERTVLAKQYKNNYITVLERYITSKAKLLGVRPVEITSKLNESYNIDDIDAVCDQILTESVSINRLPFGNSRKATVKINESKQTAKSVANDPEDGFDLDSLMSFAGLQ